MAEIPNGILQVFSWIVGVIVIVISTLATAFFAMAKWGFVSHEQCNQFRDECHSACERDRAKTGEALTFKLDGICTEVKKLRDLMDKDHDRYIELIEFVGNVKGYMDSHK